MVAREFFIVNGEIHRYADDITIYVAASSPDMVAVVLNVILKKLHEWSRLNRLIPHPGKTDHTILMRGQFVGEQSQAGSRQSRLGSQVGSRVGSRQSYPGIPPIPPGIPTGILEPPTWDPANPTRDPSYILDKIPHGIWPQIPGGIPPIPPGIPASFHAKSRQSHLATYVFPGWDPANPTWDPKFVPCEIPGGIPQSHLGLTCL